MSARFAILNPSAKRRADVSGGESLPKLRSRRAILIGAFLTAIFPVMAQSTRVCIRVTDVTGAVIPRAEVSLLGPDGEPQRTEQANEMGEIVWTDLPIGESKIYVTSRGFADRRLVVTVRNSDEVTVDAQLEIGRGVMVVANPAQSGQVTQSPRPKRRWWQIFR